MSLPIGNESEINLSDIFERQSDSTNDLLRPNYVTDHVTLDSRELAMMKKADKKLKRRQQRMLSKSNKDYAGYKVSIPEDIQKLFSMQKEKSFTLRRVSEARGAADVEL